MVGHFRSRRADLLRPAHPTASVASRIGYATYANLLFFSSHIGMPSKSPLRTQAFVMVLRLHLRLRAWKLMSRAAACRLLTSAHMQPSYKGTQVRHQSRTHTCKSCMPPRPRANNIKCMHMPSLACHLAYASLRLTHVVV